MVAADPFDERPAQQPRSLLGDLAAPRLGVGLMVLGCESGPRTQVRGCRKAGHVTDLGDENRGDGRADTLDRLHRPIATIALEVLMDVALEHHDLAVVVLDQLPQRLHPDREVASQVELVQLTSSGRAEHVIDTGERTSFAITACT